jgi:hypothetical protein
MLKSIIIQFLHKALLSAVVASPHCGRGNPGNKINFLQKIIKSSEYILLLRRNYLKPGLSRFARNDCIYQNLSCFNIVSNTNNKIDNFTFKSILHQGK